MKSADAKAAGLLRESPGWWMSYYGPDGKRVRESTEKVKKSEAQDVLAIRVGAVAKGEAIPPRLDKMTYDIARDDLIIHYEISGERDLVEFRKRLAHLNTYFRGRRLASVGPADATAYAKLRLSEKVTRSGKTRG